MVSSSSSGREFLSANPSPEHYTASNSSSSEYESVLEELQNNITIQTDVIGRGRRHSLESRSSSSLARLRNSHMNMTRVLDVTVPLLSNIHQSNHSSTFSATASEFIPWARRSMPIMSKEEKSFGSHSRISSTAVPRLSRSNYDNQVSGVPTHWIPIYGAGHGIFYDIVSKLFYGDGAPRLTLERSDGSMQPIDDSIPVSPFGFQSEDILHLQPPSMVETVVKEVENDSNTLKRYYCRCKDAWLKRPHDCPVEWEGQEGFVDKAIPMQGMAAIRPGDVVPLESITHDIAVGDLSYLTPQQRYAYEHGLPILMPSVTGRMGVISSQVDTEGVGMRIRGESVGS
ncbi:MAG: hypothetical protein Q9188_000380 [Gyalolechia gomerana]